MIDSFRPDWSLLRSSLPAVLSRYNLSQFRSDALAAATVAMISIPQAIGFALIAGLPPAMVIGCVAAGGLAASLFTSSRYLIFGPSNSLSMLLAAAFASSPDAMLTPVERAVVLAVMIGIVQLGAGLLRFGQLTQFFSRSVVLGYGSAIGALLIASQIHHLAGVPQDTTSALASAGDTILRAALLELGPQSCAVSVSALLLFWLVRRIGSGLPDTLIGLAALALASRLLHWEEMGIATLGSSGGSLAAFSSLTDVATPAATLQSIRHLATPALAIALLGMLEAVSIAKSYGVRTGDRTDTNRELVAMGLGNLASACCGSMPGSASFARSAANFQARAATQVAGALSGLMVLGIAHALSPLLDHLPLPALAAALVRVGWRMIDVGQARIAMRSTRSDALVLVGTFASALLLPLDTAIYMGIGLSIALALRKASTPFLVEFTFDESNQLAQLEDKTRRPHPQIAIIHVEGELFFGAADLFQEHVRQQAERENLRVIVLRLKNARHLDATTVFALIGLHEWLALTGRQLIVSGVHGEVLHVLRRSGLLQRIGQENVFPAELNPNLATRKALLRARALLGGGAVQPDVRLFFDRHPAATAHA